MAEDMPEVKKLLSDAKDVTEITRMLSDAVKQQNNGK